MKNTRTIALLITPVFLALTCKIVGGVIPTDEVWGAVGQALLLSAPRWFMLLYPIGAIYSYFRRVRREKGAAPPPRKSLGATAVVGLFGLVAAGNPFAGSGSTGSEAFSVMSANVQAFTDGAHELEIAIGDLGVDLFMQIEMRAVDVPGMRRVADNYNTGLAMPSHGMGIYCSDSIECEGAITENFGTSICGMPMSLVRVNSEICVMGLHVPPPAPFCALGVAPYVEEMLSHVSDGVVSEAWGPCQSGDPIVIAGDLNGVPGGYGYQSLTGAGLKDPQATAGIWASSWPAGGGWPNMPVFRLDHVFAGRGVEVTGLGHQRLPGADHKALRFSITLQ
jgi:hypothetical protein